MPARGRTATVLLAILALGLALRLLGLGWGLPGRHEWDRAPLHPDEHEPYVGSLVLYDAPAGGTFAKGGAFYLRLGWLARTGAEALLGVDEAGAQAATIAILRGANVLFALGAIALMAVVGSALGRQPDAPGASSGAAVALGAAALLACFPTHVLDTHWARPEVLVTFLCTAALACACRALGPGGTRALVWGGAFAGLATATMLSGGVGFGALLASAVLRHRGAPARERVRAASRDVGFVGLAAAGAYAFGNAEALLAPEAFLGGLRVASDTHQGGHYAFPWRHLHSVSLYAFGGIGALAGFVGVAILLLRRRPVDLVVASQWLVGWLLIGRVGGDMMRHLETVAPPTAAAAALALVMLARWLAVRLGRPRATAAVVLGVAVLLTAQLSIAYVGSMQFGEDARYRMGERLASQVAPGRSVGITTSFHGDKTYGPRFRADRLPFRVRDLMLRANYDASRYLALGLDYIATSEYARSHAVGETAPAFFRDLFAQTGYRLVAREGPLWEPLVCLPDLLGMRRPSDLHYVFSTYYAFERRPRQDVRGPRGDPGRAVGVGGSARIQSRGSDGGAAATGDCPAPAQRTKEAASAPGHCAAAVSSNAKRTQAEAPSSSHAARRRSSTSAWWS